MHKKLCIILIINTLMVSDQLIANSYMHNLYAIFAKFRDICKQFAGNLINEEYTSMWCRSQIFRLGSGCAQYGF